MKEIESDKKASYIESGKEVRYVSSNPEPNETAIQNEDRKVNYV